MIEKELNDAFQKIDYQNYDNLETANETFMKLLLKYTSSNPQTLKYKFRLLEKNGLGITTSQDGKFRIYSWDTWTGGTMHFFKNVYQYEANNRVYSKTIESVKYENVNNDSDCFFYQINDIVSGNKKYYITQSSSILSSALSYHNVKIFSIDGNKLNDDARLIKTKNGIQNQLGYELDLTVPTNQNKNIRNYNIEYDAKNKIISIPLILENSKIINKRIRYQFKGKYFELIK